MACPKPTTSHVGAQGGREDEAAAVASGCRRTVVSDTGCRGGQRMLLQVDANIIAALQV